MRRIVLFLACFTLWCTVHAQWTFTVDYTSHCSGWDDFRATLEGEHIKSEYNNRQYPSRNACEAARNSIHSPMSCLVLHCTPCTGHDVGGESSTVSADPNVNPSLLGPNYGASITPTNKADEIKQWIRDFYKQNGLAFDEDFFDEWYANNTYFSEKMNEMYAQMHAQMMELNNRDEFWGLPDSIQQHYLVTTHTGYAGSELKMNVEEHTVVNLVSLGKDGMPYLNPNAINPKIDLPDMESEMEKTEPRTQPYTYYTTDISDESHSVLGDFISDFLEKNDNWVYAFEQLFPKTSSMEKIARDNGVNLDLGDALWTISEGVATEVGYGWLPWKEGKRTEEALTSFAKTTLGEILNYSKSDLTDTRNIEHLSMTYTKATIDMFAHIAGGHPMQKLIKFGYNVRYGRP